MKKDTITNHFKADVVEHDNPALVMPIYQSVKFTFDDYSQMKALFARQRQGYFYSRYKNPTVQQLEKLLATLQGTESGLACASGIGAISTTLFSLLSAGDKIVYFIESYKPTRVLIENTLSRFGVEGVKLSLSDMDSVARAFEDDSTRFVIWESPSNPQMTIPDNQQIMALARAHGVMTIMDNTFAGFHNNGSLGADIYLHSLTKYASGHGDVMGGVILATNAVIDAIHQQAVEIGSVLDPHAAFLVLRGMKTYHLRYEKQASNAWQVARWLDSLPFVEKVFYPGLELQQEQAHQCGTVLMFNLVSKNIDIEALINALRLFRLAASLGSTESLVAPALYFYGGDLTKEELTQASLDETSIRLSFGIEVVEDLIHDLKQAFLAVDLV